MTAPILDVTAWSCATCHGLFPHNAAGSLAAEACCRGCSAHREHAFRAVPCGVCGDYRSGREEVVKVSRADSMPFGGSEDAPPLVLCLACARRIGEAVKVRR